jgi:hypothetical protein
MGQVFGYPVLLGTQIGDVKQMRTGCAGLQLELVSSFSVFSGID